MKRHVSIIVGFTAALFLFMGLALHGQAPAGARSAPTSVPRTPWGDPDLQGVWSSDSEAGVPFERPQDLGGKATFTVEELEQVEQEREDQRADRAPTLGGVTGAGPTHWFEDWGQKSNRTSLVIDPPDGRVPPLTPEAQRRGRGFGGGAGSFGNGPFNSYTDFATWDRCITRGVPAVMFPMIYNNNSRITQAPGLVAITYEMIHETRVIPVDRRPHLADGLRQWLGDPRGYWDGDTLVVESKNFTDRINYRGSGQNLTLVERFRRDGSGLRYEVTVIDPQTFTRPWTAALNLKPTVDMFEYACHEGNYAMRNMLSAARAAEKAK
jgi:hypothetical protein